MRNWHHNIIRLEQAHSLLGTNYVATTIGVSEDTVQFKILEENADWIDPPNYKPIHPSFGDIAGIRKIVLRNYFANRDVKYNSSQLTKSSLIKDESNKFSFHSIAVTGIISSNDLNNNLKGISFKSHIISTQNIFNSSLVAKINPISSKDILSKYKSLYTLPDDKVKIPATYEDNFLPYDSWSAGVINQSQFFTVPRVGDFLNYSNSFNFILQELFAYGRNGRGVLYVCASGNGKFDINSSIPQGIEIDANNFVQAFSNKSFIVGASYIDPNENNYNALATGYQNGTIVMPEEVAEYSNYGKRLDIVAPSSQKGNLTLDEVGVYAPSSMCGGDFGVSDEEILTKRIMNISSNLKELTLNNVYGLFKGQTIEIGSHSTYLHEFRKIKSVDYNGKIIKLENSLKFTKNLYNNVDFNNVTVELKVTVLKIAIIERIDENKFKIANRNGIMKSLNIADKFQKIFIYNKDEAEDRIDTNPSSGSAPLTKIRMINSIRSIEKENASEYYIVECVNVIPNLTNLFLIPDQMEIKVETINYGGVNSFKCLANYFLDGFFIGQKVKIGDYMANITSINYQTKIFETKHYKPVIGEQFTVTSLSYGSFFNSFGGTSAAAPVISGVAGLVLSANPQLNAAEVKNIMKITAKKITGNGSYNSVNNPQDYNYGYTTNQKLGVGRVDAEAAVQLALNWHNGSTSKPVLEIEDGPTNSFDSPDIIMNNNINLNSAENISIKINVKNSGTLRTFKECDVRILLAIIPEENDSTIDSESLLFKFPDFWYNNPKTKDDLDLFDKKSIALIGVKDLPTIAPNSNQEIEFLVEKIKFKEIYNSYKFLNRKYRTFILAHISPFDGLDSDVKLINYRSNKQLTCKEIVISQTDIMQGTGYLPGNNLNINVNSQVVSKNFELVMDNFLSTQLEQFKVLATLKNNNETIDEISFVKNDDVWVLEGSTGEWITFEQPIIVPGSTTDYNKITFPHTLNVNNEKLEVKLEIVNI